MRGWCAVAASRCMMLLEVVRAPQYKAISFSAPRSRLTPCVHRCAGRPVCSVRYSNTFTYSRYKRTVQLSKGPRLKDSMRQFMEKLSVEAYDLQVCWHMPSSFVGVFARA